MTMVFRHGFFHSDPHPANIFVLESGELGLVDFGQAGKLTDDDMAGLTRLFVDAATENVDAIPRRLRELGVQYAPEREEEFRRELQVLFDRYYGTGSRTSTRSRSSARRSSSSTRSTSSSPRAS